MDYASRERFLPCLLQRLKSGRDTARKGRTISVSIQEYRESVMADLSRLLNAKPQPSVNAFEEFRIRKATPGVNFYRYPEVAKSVINYGFADLSGMTKSSLDLTRLKYLLRDVIKQFEPRILADSLEIKLEEKDRFKTGVIHVEIRGKIWAKPIPEEILRKGELDLISGQFILGVSD